MDGQAYIVNIIEQGMTDGGELQWVKHVTETSLLKIPSFPAVIVEDTSDLINEVDESGTPYLRTDKLLLALMIESKNLNAMSWADYVAGKNYIREKFEQLQNEIHAWWNTGKQTSEETGHEERICGIAIEEATLDYMLVDSKPVMVKTAEIKVQITK